MRYIKYRLWLKKGTDLPKQAVEELRELSPERDEEDPKALTFSFEDTLPTTSYLENKTPTLWRLVEEGEVAYLAMAGMDPSDECEAEAVAHAKVGEIEIGGLIEPCSDEIFVGAYIDDDPDRAAEYIRKAIQGWHDFKRWTKENTQPWPEEVLE